MSSKDRDQLNEELAHSVTKTIQQLWKNVLKDECQDCTQLMIDMCRHYQRVDMTGEVIHTRSFQRKCSQLLQMVHMARKLKLYTMRLEPDTRDMQWDDLALHEITCVLEHPITLSNCYCKESPIHGLGVFTRRDLSPGEIITFFPADVVLQQDTVKGETMVHCSFRTRNAIQDQWPNASNQELRRCIPDSIRALPWLWDHLTVCQDVAVAGDPAYHDDPAFLAHMCNDGARLNLATIDKFRTNPDLQDKLYDVYTRVSLFKRNADLCRMGPLIFLVAIHSIAAEQEILVSYGEHFWTDNKDDRYFQSSNVSIESL